MDEAQIAQLLFRWLHVGTAIVLLGGSVFLRFVLLPAAEKLSAEAHEALRGHLLATWKIFVHAGVLLLLLSGLYNYLVVMLPLHRGDSLYHALMGTKILLALVVFFLAEALVGRAAAFENLRQKRRLWLGVIVLLAALIVALSGFLKVRGPAPGSAGGPQALMAPRAGP
ncbi:MAG: hypothetical protein L0Z62_28010 [Gemmataceae bacterium]|nr:hypothetical protein [Gemmataceae bacterium]